MIVKEATNTDMMEEFNIDVHPGYMGVFTRDQAVGAIPNGTRIVKTKSEPGDSHPDGTPGTVLGSFRVDDQPAFYFVEWDCKPRIAVALAGHRIKEADA